jgi:hypothetical protein
MGIIVDSLDDGTQYIMDPTTGKVGLFSPDGTYFIDGDDYDHGWVWRKPGMGYSQIRRSKAKTFFKRAETVWMVALAAVVFPVFLGVTFVLSGNLMFALPAYLVVQCGAAALTIWWVHDRDRSLFEYVWFGRLYKPEDKLRAGIR